jgi:hypothetical protein
MLSISSKCHHLGRPRVAAGLALVLFLFLALAAQAAVPPLSEPERLAQSHTVVTGRIVEITDEGLVELKRPGDGSVVAVLHVYSASLEVLSVEKGEAKVGDVITVRYHQTQQGPPGPQGQNQLLPAQGQIRVFLKSISGSTSSELLQPNGWDPISAP